jgi:HAD superfamily hydrolase (TIGR01490 family)
MTKRPFAVFDIDGTLIRWQLYHAVADKLAKHGALRAADFDKVRASRMTWKNRSSEQSFDHYEQQLVALVNDAINSISVQEVEAAYDEVITEYRDQVYTYTRDLIDQLRRQNYLLFAISGSQVEMVKLLAEHYGFDDYGGTVYERQGDRFTGRNEPLRSDRKPTYLKELVKKHGAGWQGSVGVGDSESDIAMLSLVERPIAFNPTKQLFQHAAQHGWEVVLERKNMVYELQPPKSKKGKDGSYLLAQTNA